MLIGIGEIVLLPLDRLKILSQTNDHALKNRNIFQIFATEGMGMYAGAGVTAVGGLRDEGASRTPARDAGAPPARDVRRAAKF